MNKCQLSSNLYKPTWWIQIRFTHVPEFQTSSDYPSSSSRHSPVTSACRHNQPVMWSDWAIVAASQVFMWCLWLQLIENNYKTHQIIRFQPGTKQHWCTEKPSLKKKKKIKKIFFIDFLSIYTELIIIFEVSKVF